MSEYANLIRESFHNGDQERDKNNTIPDDVVRYENIRYSDFDEKWNLLDVYRPKNINGKLPVIMSIHGGGWVYGDKDVYQWYCMSLAQRGFAVVNYSYRLAPEYPYPASFEDTSCVADWIIQNAETYGFDINHIFGVGDSAGAHMLSLFSAALTNPNYHVPYTLPKHFQFTAIALNCGIYDMVAAQLGDTAKLMEDYLPNHGTSEEYHEISTIHFITSDFPSCFIMTCPGDFLYAAPESLVSVLKKNGVPFVYRTYGSAKNPLAHVFHCNMQLPEAKQCNDDECAFFQSFMK